MFDIGFSELLVIAVVALVVIGPERLPKVARTMGHLFGRMQRYVNTVKADISREMELDELRKLQGSVTDAARSLEDSFRSEVRQAEAGLKSVEEGITGAAADAAPKPASAPAAADPKAAPAALPGHDKPA
ncbi:MAG TPA: Sec-independent protein translocase protein TatB [Burkholderiales bacterium]